MNLRDAYHSFMEKTTFAKKCPNVIYKVVSNAIDTKAFSLAYHMLLAVIPSYKAEKEKSKSYFLSKKGIIEENLALTGTHETILKFRPRLAISIYHSDEDMVEIIQRISRNYPFYDLYVRHYTGFFAETVLYCIEKK